MANFGSYDIIMSYYRLIPFCFFLAIMTLTTPASANPRVLDALDRGAWDTAYDIARKDRGGFIKNLATWYYLRNSDRIAPTATYQHFLKAHPQWPDAHILRKRMELSFLNDTPSREELSQWFNTHPPLSPRAQLMQQVGRGHIDGTLLHTLWVEGNFSNKEQDTILSLFGKQITTTSHEARIDRLLWDGQTSDAERLLGYASKNFAKLTKARIALRQRRSGVDKLVNAVPQHLQSHAGLLYERMRFRARRKNHKGAAEILAIAPATLPNAKLWWNTQKRIIRDAIEDGDYGLAKTLLDKHSQITALPRVEAEWMRGWLYHAFLRQPKTAHLAFTNIYNTARYGISRSRGAYWAARAAEDMGEKRLAKRWYDKAAIYPTTFYGQLAHQTLHPNTALPLPRMSPVSDKALDKFVEKNTVARYFQQFARSKQSKLIWPIIKYEMERNGSPEFAEKMAALSTRVGAHRTGIKIAKEALHKGLYLPQLFPIIETPSPLAIDPAFALAIARQESRFDIKASSSANARGLMQLLPNTAKLTARKHGINYDINQLYQPQYNMLLGSHFMNGLLKRFDNAYILSIAGYNAGPGRSVQWEERFGALNNNYKRNIQWIETIPFSETRNYVQRVLENYHVYKHLLGQGKLPLQSQEQLIRQ